MIEIIFQITSVSSVTAAKTKRYPPRSSMCPFTCALMKEIPFKVMCTFPQTLLFNHNISSLHIKVLNDNNIMRAVFGQDVFHIEVCN